ncbi:hypothetical protein LUZ60_005386 [Juncus effusus]|nr:hypothetical protein LUZ60_005386 [Juncus effusus]
MADPVDLAIHPSGIIPTLQNVVATVNLDCELNLEKIASKLPNAEYSNGFARLVMRITEPKTTAMIFASGKMVITGAKNEQQSKQAGRKGYNIQNIVASCDVTFAIILEGLAYAHSAFCTYEPEQFPGLRYRMKEPKVTILVFVSGKVVLTGAKNSYADLAVYSDALWVAGIPDGDIIAGRELAWYVVID